MLKAGLGLAAVAAVNGFTPALPVPSLPNEPPRLTNIVPAPEFNSVGAVPVDGDIDSQILALVKTIEEDFAIVRELKSEVRAIRSNLDRGCTYTPPAETAQCLAECQNPVVPPTQKPFVPPTQKPLKGQENDDPKPNGPTNPVENPATRPSQPATPAPSTIPKLPPPNFDQILSDRCVADKACNADDAKCLANCANRWRQYCTNDAYKCFYNTNDAEAANWDNRGACFDACQENTSDLLDWMSQRSIVTRNSVITTIKTLNSRGFWSLDYMSDYLKARCIANNICEEGNTKCYEVCAKTFNRFCNQRDYVCFHDDLPEKPSTHTDREECIDQCVAGNPNIQSEFSLVAERNAARYNRGDFKLLGWMNERAVAENICNADDENCLIKVNDEWGANCANCLYQQESSFRFITGFNTREECFNDCQANGKHRYRLRKGLLWAASHFSGRDESEVRFLTGDGQAEPNWDQNGDWSFNYIKTNIRARCISSGVCGENQTNCLEACANKWKHFCGRNDPHNCFNQNNFDNFDSRDACFDSCEARTLDFRNQLNSLYTRFNSGQTLQLVDFIDGQWDIDGRWYIRSVRAFTANRCVASGVCDADNQECLNACGDNWRRFCNGGSYICFFNGKLNSNFANQEECMNQCESKQENIREALNKIHGQYGTSAALNLLEYTGKEQNGDKRQTQILEYEIDGRKNKWTRELLNGEPVSEWIRVLGTDPRPEENKPAGRNENRTVTIGDDVMTWTRFILAGGDPQPWQQTTGTMKFNTPDEAMAYAQRHFS